MAIALVEKYVDLLDEVYAVESRTSVLDGDTSLVQAGSNAHTIKVPYLTLDGLGDYSRTSGYTQGTVSVGWEEKALDYDRGRKFSVDDMDNEETIGVAFGKLSSAFVRTKVAREIDAYRFAQYAGMVGISTVSAAVLDTADKWLAALTAAKTTMDDDEVPEEGRYLFITPTGKNLIDGMDTYKSRAMIDSFAGVISVPQTRFCTSIELLDGSTAGETKGGFLRNGNDINFMIIEKSAVMQYIKHQVNKVITPAENQSSDSWLFFFRSYGIAEVLDMKTAGVYLHKSTVVQNESA